jgi:hypothetical protein
MADSPFGPRKVRSQSIGPGQAPPTVEAQAAAAGPAALKPPPKASWAQRKADEGTAETVRPAAAPFSAAAVSKPNQRAKPARDLDRYAAVVQAFLRYRGTMLRVHWPRLVQSHVVRIQDELRDYLLRTRFTRGVLRQRREAKLLALNHAIDRLVQTCRSMGRELLLEEAEVRRRLADYHTRKLLRALEEEETRVRTWLWEDAEEEAAVAMQHCPPEFEPGNPQQAEFASRNHIVKLWRTEWSLFTMRHLAAIAGDLRKRQAAGRESIRVDEATDRLHLVANAVAGAAVVRCCEVERQEENLRLLYERQRDEYVMALRVQRTLTTRSVIAAAAFVPEAEPYQRNLLLRTETAQRKELFASYTEQWFRLMSRETLADEATARRALARHEADARSRVAGALVGVKMFLLQRDCFDDVQCEFGARTAIRWAEQKQRHAILARHAVDTAGMHIPGEEQAARLRLCRLEATAFMGIVSFAPIRQIVAAQEMAQRRELFRQWVSWLREALFGFARLALMAAEEQRRRQLLLRCAVEDTCDSAAEYLWGTEVDERRMLARSLAKLQTLHRAKTQAPDAVVVQLPSSRVGQRQLEPSPAISSAWRAHGEPPGGDASPHHPRM